ncbi:MAG: hypothetical protein LBH44_03585 [Treponema sp.]|jgi:hypothetical protein|nr:hypothetical protein [Treponema sp.]
MKKSRILKVFSIVLFVAVLSGCFKEVKPLPPLDKNTAAEESAVLIIPSYAKIMRIDGAKRGLLRSWWVGYWSSWSHKSKAATLLLPAGEHTINFNYAQKADGWSARNMEHTVTMDAGKMYLLSVTLDGRTRGGKVSTAINAAGSFIRDDFVAILPFIDRFPRSNPEGIAYDIYKIDQAAFDQYLLEETKVKNLGFSSFVALIALGVAMGLLSLLWYFMFMGKLMSRHPFIAIILCIAFYAAGIIVINYNSGGILYLYLLAFILMNIGTSGRKPTAGLKAK